MVFHGYIDESYNQRMFTLSAILATGIEWAWFESAWKKRIAVKNKTLRAQGRQQITRFHASDFSNRMGEFSDWTIDEQTGFMKELISVFRNPKGMYITAYTMPLETFAAEFSEVRRNTILPFCYAALLKFLMYEIAKQFEIAARQGPVRTVSITLFHDRSPFDASLLEAFEQVVAEKDFEGAKYFSKIAPLCWEDSIALQAADLLAYEHMKDADRMASGSIRQQRKSLTALLDLSSLGGRTMRFDKKALHKLRLHLERRSPRG